jgi:hypothetical protein
MDARLARARQAKGPKAKGPEVMFRVGDPGWQNARVQLFGHDIRNCVALETGDAGWVDVIVLDDAGRPSGEMFEQRRVKTERIHGDVVLSFPPMQ